ncbi:uncharacterized protein LOC135826574 [Sycon ciliatum]|uniref:uncharacterized protein LOC135826574 n=1 Tax=Sycon ciliatum TaxID=27933 RepID=UPI0031F6811A
MARHQPVSAYLTNNHTPTPCGVRCFPAPQRMESVGKRRMSHDGKLASFLLKTNNTMNTGSSNASAAAAAPATGGFNTFSSKPNNIHHTPFHPQLSQAELAEVCGGDAAAAAAAAAANQTNSGVMRSLELDGVIRLLKMYDEASGPEIVCCICGKPYKSKVCFTKHIWEHSVYWDKFDGFKNHERVLSIQAAIILTHAQDLSFLLVTGPNIDKKQQQQQQRQQQQHQQQEQEQHISLIIEEEEEGVSPRVSVVTPPLSGRHHTTSISDIGLFQEQVQEEEEEEEEESLTTTPPQSSPSSSELSDQSSLVSEQSSDLMQTSPPTRSSSPSAISALTFLPKKRRRFHIDLESGSDRSRRSVSSSYSS